MSTQERVSKILAGRHARLPRVRELILHWTTLGDEIGALGAAVDVLRANPGSTSVSGMAPLPVATMKSEIDEALRLLHTLEARLSRDTINIGVSGRARVGKSTLLQAFSGLGEDQIPTGEGLPVTAVRSRIFHSGAHARATLSLHSFETFRRDVLTPYHRELSLPAAPSSIAEFRRLEYPTPTESWATQQKKHSKVTMLHRLREMQESLWSYENDLTGTERIIELGDLRQYVAYPTEEELRRGNCARRYLAVRDVRIECPFPDAKIDHLGIVDLPGLGEVAVDAQKHHLNGLENEVDIVLMVKRAVEGAAYWTDEDANTTNLLDDARGFIHTRGDFVLLLINRVLGDEALAKSLRGSLLREANGGHNGTHFTVLEGDAKNRVTVFPQILAPVLEHLVERLPAMDSQVIQGTNERCLAVLPGLRGALSDTEQVLSSRKQQSVSSVEDMLRRTDELRKDLASEYAELLSEFQSARDEDEDPAFLEAVADAYRGIHEWIESGFGVGKEAWQTDALRQMRVDKHSHGVIGEAMNHVRVEISRRYCSLDNYFQGRLNEYWTTAAGPLKRHLGLLMADRDGGDAFDNLAETLEHAAEPCPKLGTAIRELRELRLDYRTHLHPRVRRALDGLTNQQLNSESGKLEARLTVEVSENGVEQLYRWLSQAAQQAAYLTHQALLGEAMTPALVLHAALEQFEDVLIRSRESGEEFRRLTRTFRDDIWPGVYKDLEHANARLSRVRGELATVRRRLDQIEGEKV